METRAGREGRGEAGSDRTWGERLRRYRAATGLTQEELAERSGYSTGYIGKLERDQRRPPKLAIDRLAAALDLDEREWADLRTTRELPAALRAAPAHPTVPSHPAHRARCRARRGARRPRHLPSGDPHWSWRDRQDPPCPPGRR